MMNQTEEFRVQVSFKPESNLGNRDIRVRSGWEWVTYNHYLADPHTAFAVLLGRTVETGAWELLSSDAGN